MIVMPANNSNAYQLSERYPGRIGMMMGPGGWKDPRGLPYALDNGRFSVWAKGRQWNEDLFCQLLARAASCSTAPSWLVVPDVVADAVATIEEWRSWEPRLRNLGWPLALAVQDGMSPDTVKRYAKPDVIFVGGSTDWKRNTIWAWCQSFPRVHIGRVNTQKWLWNAQRCGAESCDGTGWFRGDQQQLNGLHRYLKISSSGLSPRQREIAYADGFRHDKKPHRDKRESDRHQTHAAI
jgi:hypothetical protein